MLYRGRGRGSGRGGSGSFAKPEQFTLYPDVELPSVSGVPENRALVAWSLRLQNFWKSSSYYLEEATATKSKSTEIDRYSDRDKTSIQARRDPLSYHLKLTPANFPQELIQGSKRVQHDQRKVRWNPESGFQKLDLLERRERDKDEKEKKEGEEEEEEEGIEVEEEGISDDDDYNQNIDFDDDEDDFNMDEGEDEAIM